MLRKTKIICTMGPACESEEILRQLMLNGMNVARFNFSHGDYKEQQERLDRLVKVRTELNLPVAALMDTKGPEIRLGVFENGKETITDGQTFTLTTDDILGTAERATVTYKGLKNDVKVGSTILINDGLLELKVDKITEKDIVCTVVHGGVISNRKGINVPGVELTMPYLSDVDTSDILYAAEAGFDFIAASFVRNKEDVDAIHDLLKGKNEQIKIIAKIENRQGVENLDEILEEADGIMVARGDMGVEIPFEEVPHIQKMMIQKAILARKHVITATQMLDSMISNPRPTRAEVADVANAVYDGTTAIMLSGETAAGKFPIEAVKAMASIAIEAERNINYEKQMASRKLDKTGDITSAVAYAACTTAIEIGASAIIPVTMFGKSALKVAALKPPMQVLACSPFADVCRKMSLMWGVTSVQIQEKKIEADLLAEAVAACKEAGYIKAGERVVMIAGVPLGLTGNTNMIRVVEVE